MGTFFLNIVCAELSGAIKVLCRGFVYTLNVLNIGIYKLYAIVSKSYMQNKAQISMNYLLHYGIEF